MDDSDGASDVIEAVPTIETVMNDEDPCTCTRSRFKGQIKPGATL